ncbi:MAG: anti-sigma factor family protein [Anaerovoracaceae bacterium]|jgi:hypothetical protein|nr:zf-HC2 domain-containing protein [Clostridiales bacterium]
MKCDKTREMLSLYIDKMLDDNLKKEIEEHISTCNLCKKEYDDIMEIVTHLNEVEMVSVPKSFEHRLKNALQHERSKISDSKIIAISDKKKNKLRMLTSIAAIFAVGLISVGLYQDIIGGVTDQLDGTAQLAQDQVMQERVMNNETESDLYNSKLYKSNLDEAIDEKQKFEIKLDVADDVQSSDALKPRMSIYGYTDDNSEPGSTKALVPENYVDNPSVDGDSDGYSKDYSTMMTSEEFSRALTIQAIERNVAAVQFYKGLIEDNLRDFNYEILESDFVQAGECRFRIYIFNSKEGYVFNEEIIAIGKDGEIEFIYTNEFMGL